MADELRCEHLNVTLGWCDDCKVEVIRGPLNRRNGVVVWADKEVAADG